MSQQATNVSRLSMMSSLLFSMKCVDHNTYHCFLHIYAIFAVKYFDKKICKIEKRRTTKKALSHEDSNDATPFYHPQQAFPTTGKYKRAQIAS